MLNADHAAADGADHGGRGGGGRGDGARSEWIKAAGGRLEKKEAVAAYHGEGWPPYSAACA